MLNSCDFTGRLAGDPKVFEKDGVLRAVFTLAVDRDQKQEDGTYETDFLDFIAWRSTAEFVQKYFHSGDMATVSNARAQVRRFIDSNNVKQRRVEFAVDRVYFGQAKKRDEEMTESE